METPNDNQCPLCGSTSFVEKDWIRDVLKFNCIKCGKFEIGRESFEDRADELRSLTTSQIEFARQRFKNSDNVFLITNTNFSRVFEKSSHDDEMIENSNHNIKSNEMQNIKVFMSYSHDNPKYKECVRQLCDKLLADGVEIIFDQYHLHAGSRISKFMARITEADRVIMMCSKKYVQKVKEGKGGVAYEESIMSAEMMKNIDEKKFVPILVDISPDDLPVSVSDVYAINFRNGWWGEAYDELLVTLLPKSNDKSILRKLNIT